VFAEKLLLTEKRLDFAIVQRLNTTRIYFQNFLNIITDTSGLSFNFSGKLQMTPQNIPSTQILGQNGKPGLCI